MLILAFQYMTACPSEHLKEVMELFSLTTLEICEGQQLDMEFESRCDVTEDEYIEMIRLKTAVLLAGSLKIGAILAGATAEDADNLYNFGMQIGVAFQLQDDWLDTYGDPAIFGKEIGGDIVNRKKTWLLITALNESDGDLADILREDLSDHELVAQVRRVYDRLNLRERCSALAEEYSQKAIKALESVEMDADARNFFTELAKQASTRAH